MKTVTRLLAVLAISVLASPTRGEEVSPGKARLYSMVLPGAGHLYAGDGGTGAVVMSLYLSSVVVAAATGPWGWHGEPEGPANLSELSEGTSPVTKFIFIGAAVTAMTTWIYAVVDAPKVARNLVVAPRWTRDGPALAVQLQF
jgi:hypothetical protein